MISLGLDVGDRRIGLAISGDTGLIARPLAVIRHGEWDRTIAAVQRVLVETGAAQIVVGMPLLTSDQMGAQARKTSAFVQRLSSAVSVPVVTWDERYSTAVAQERLIELGIGAKRRRELLDAAAAAVLLQDYLDAH